jgi:hypothetical protein
MPSPTAVTTMLRRLIPVITAALLVLVLVFPAAAQADDTTTVSTGSSTTTSSVEPASSSSTTAPSESSAPAIVPPAEGTASPNPGWQIDQMQIQILPEYDQRAVLVVLRFSLPASVPLPATMQLPIPAGAQIAGIGEIDPNGQYKYNYQNSYPTVQPGDEWDEASIDVKDYRDVQIDYYYDPGFPAAAGPRSFPLLVQIPMDVGTLILHVQHPSKAIDFQIQPALQGSGQAGDGFTYDVATYADVKGGSTLGHTVSYTNPDGGLSINATSSGSKVSMTAALLGAILFVLVVIAGFMGYRMYVSARKPKAKPAVAKSGRRPQPSGAAVGKGKRPTAAKSQNRKAVKPDESPTVTMDESAVADEPDSDEGDEGEDVEGDGDNAPGVDDDAEHCTVCGEQLTPKFRYCPGCGEPRP